MNVLREAVYTVWSTQHEVRQPCTLTLSSHMSLSGTFMALDHMQHMPSWSLARSFENNWKVLNFFLWRLFAFWAAFSFSSFPSLTMTRMSINVFLLSMIASWFSLRSTKSNNVVIVSHKRERLILLLLNFFQMLNMFSMQLDASQLATKHKKWKAMTLRVNSDGSNVSQTHVLVFGGMLGSPFTVDTRVAAKFVALQHNVTYYWSIWYKWKKFTRTWWLAFYPTKEMSPFWPIHWKRRHQTLAMHDAMGYTDSCVVDDRWLLALKCFLHKTCRQPKHSAKERKARPPSDRKVGRSSSCGKYAMFGAPSSTDCTNFRYGGAHAKLLGRGSSQSGW